MQQVFLQQVGSLQMSSWQGQRVFAMCHTAKCCWMLALKLSMMYLTGCGPQLTDRSELQISKWISLPHVMFAYKHGAVLLSNQVALTPVANAETSWRMLHLHSFLSRLEEDLRSCVPGRCFCQCSRHFALLFAWVSAPVATLCCHAIMKISCYQMSQVGILNVLKGFLS